MTPEKVLAVIKRYKKLYPEVPATPIHHREPGGDMGDIAHFNYILEQIEIFVAEKRLGKAFRWLGFAQGILWMMNIYSIEELANHNRPGPHKTEAYSYFEDGVEYHSTRKVESDEDSSA